MAGADGAPVHVWVTVVRHWQDNLADLPLTTVNVTWWNAMRVGCAQERNRSRGAGEVIFHTPVCQLQAKRVSKESCIVCICVLMCAW